MRILVMLLLDTLPMLGNVLLLCFFVFFIFGIVGVQLWKGLLRNRCFLDLNTTTIPDHALFEYVVFASSNTENGWEERRLMNILLLVTFRCDRSIFLPIKTHLSAPFLNQVE